MIPLDEARTSTKLLLVVLPIACLWLLVEFVLLPNSMYHESRLKHALIGQARTTGGFSAGTHVSFHPAPDGEATIDHALGPLPKGIIEVPLGTGEIRGRTERSGLWAPTQRLFLTTFQFVLFDLEHGKGHPKSHTEFERRLLSTVRIARANPGHGHAWIPTDRECIDALRNAAIDFRNDRPPYVGTVSFSMTRVEPIRAGIWTNARAAAAGFLILATGVPLLIRWKRFADLTRPPRR